MKKIISVIALTACLLTACGANDNSSSKTEGNDMNTTTTTSATTATTTTPEPEKEPRNVKVMLFGDSITDGFWLKGGYRTFLCNKLEENNYSQYVDFVGTKKSGDCYDGDHEGFTSFSIDNIQSSVTGGRSGVIRMTKRIFSKNQPDVICLQIGTNDVLSDYELDNAGERLETLVDICFENLPENGKLYLATIPVMDANDNTYIPKEHFSVEYMDQLVEKFNTQVKALVEKKKGEGKNIDLADINGVLTKEDLYDGVHPTEEGYKKMGDFWYDVIVDYITNY